MGAFQRRIKRYAFATQQPSPSLLSTYIVVTTKYWIPI